MSKTKRDIPEPKSGGTELVLLLRRAESGDPKAVAEVRSIADTRLPELWESYGNLARGAERTLISVAAGDSPLVREALTRKMETLRAELSGPAPTPLERLLVERITLCWLQVNYEDARDAQGLQKSTSWTQSLNQQKRAETAQRRLLAAVKSLATVRRLALPVLQVNIAEKQVNIGSAAGTPGNLIRQEELAPGERNG